MTLENISLTDTYGKKFIFKWEEKYPVFKNKDVKDWVKHKLEKYCRGGRNYKKFKITNYLKNLDNYCNFYNDINNPSDLLKEDVDTRNKRLIRYLNSLIEKGKSEVTVKNAIQSMIKSFYSNRGHPCSDGLGSCRTGDNYNEVILDKEAIRKFQVRLESPEYRLALKLLVETGLRADDIFKALKKGKYKLQKYKEHYFIRNFKTEKNGIIINYIFLPKEVESIMQSLYGENLEELDLENILKTNRDNDIRREDFLGRIKQIAVELGIRENVKLHSFRKFFNSIIIRHSDLDDDFKEHLLGHSNNLSRSYNNNLRDIEWFYNKWKKIEDLISIDSMIVDRTMTELTDVKKENMNLKQQIEILLESKINLEKKLRDLSKSTPNKDDIKKLVLDIMKSEQVKIDL